MKKKIILLTVVYLLAGWTSLQAKTIYYVEQNGTGNGASWNNASGNIQDMIDNASAGDEVWVAKEPYYPTTQTDVNDVRSKTFVLKDGVHLYGGFAGTETSIDDRTRSDRDGNGMVEAWEFTNEAVLSGNIDGVEDVWEKTISPLSSYDWLLTVTGDDANSYRVVSCLTEFTKETLFDGFTVTGGNNYRHGVGGGFYALGKISINNCYVVKNRASYEDVAGAGIYITFGTLSNSKVSINSSSPSYGGGIYCYNGRVNNCVVSDNYADVSGGGIYNEQGSINNCTVLNNHVRRFVGAGYYYQGARSQGGGIYNIRGTVNKCVVVNNSVYTRNGTYIGGWSSMSFGGGIYNNSGIVSNCCVNNNQVSGYSLNGTDISGGGGIYNYGDETEQGFVYNTTIVNNANNSNKSDYVKNTTNSGADYNCITNVSDLSGNFVRYTSFIGKASSEAQHSELYQADWRLKSGSEYIDAGSMENIPDWMINGADLAGNPRVHNNKIDLGAYEYNGNRSGIKELYQTSVTVFYYPATESIAISGLQGNEVFHFYNICGNLLFSRQALSETENILVGHLPSGVYLVKVDNGQTLKWIKK